MKMKSMSIAYISLLRGRGKAAKVDVVLVVGGLVGRAGSQLHRA
jgi:hypothetical protein